ncbi:MAG TPA: NADH-quinone oxidoreductase subunit N [Terriglobales bacterium]|nr:NADH-quinone oxidoreductase subunit N [Terriglobales bacterium]
MIPAQDYIRILPELVFTAFGILIMLLEPTMGEYASRKALGIVAFLGCAAALAATFYQSGYQGEAFFHMVRVDAFSTFFHAVIATVAGLVVLASLEYLDVQQIHAGEYYALILFGSAGMGLMSSAIDLVLIFIALEISSISTYVLAGIRRRAAISAEAAIKYFLLGSFATAFFLYGVAFIYGATGSTNTSTIAASLGSNYGPLVYVAVALMFVGIGFKVAAAPFHIWTPDVYEGSPAPVVALMSTGPKAAAFAVLLRVLFGTNLPGWFWPTWIAAAISMTLGNLGALVQTNIKRLLAYSSIAHAGYLLVAFCAANVGIGAAIFYTAAYAAMNVGAFAIVSHFASVGERYVTLDDYAGLGRKQPLLAACLTLLLLSLIGIPVTGGFFAKFYVFSAALNANLLGLTLIGVLNSAVAAYYYLRVIVVMYMSDDKLSEAPATPIPAGLAAVLLVSVGLTIYLGVKPNAVLNFANQGAHALLNVAGPTQAALQTSPR